LGGPRRTKGREGAKNTNRDHTEGQEAPGAKPRKRVHKAKKKKAMRSLELECSHTAFKMC
jgi:hypothetical protein